MFTSPDECARQVLEAVPMVMRTIRTEMRSHRGSDLSVPQFRVLVYLHRHEGASLSDIAEHLGLTLPSMSKMIDGLVARQLVTRQMDPGDRRRVTLAATALGRTAMQSAYKATESRLAERLAALPASERHTILKAMQVLESIFVTGREAKTAIGK
ncbi:MAG: MarR family transcriptional regulator [Desulfobaccales bacterium]